MNATFPLHVPKVYNFYVRTDRIMNFFSLTLENFRHRREHLCNVPRSSFHHMNECPLLLSYIFLNWTMDKTQRKYVKEDVNHFKATTDY
jgi:hypothetical protein